MNGIINILKEQDYTSNDVVAKLRGICHMKKIGHTGTLDPMATGVLPVCLGAATKLCDMLTDHDKVYETVMLLGSTSDTQDIWGKVESCSDEVADIIRSYDEKWVRDTIESFVGEYDQLPPMYSAKKIHGKKLYELAREGITVDRKPSKVYIHSIDILEFDLPRIRMRVHCEKGTYIRTLCSDIGDKLGCGALMESLVRERVGQFEIGNALTLSMVQQHMDAGTLSQYVIPIDDFFDKYPKYVALKEFDKLLHNGNPLPISAIKSQDVKSGLLRVYDSQGVFIGVYDIDINRQRLMPYKVFLTQY